jgi:signal transduction histidine kinase
LENDVKCREELLSEIKDLQARLEEAEEALRAISKSRNNEARQHSEDKTHWAKNRNSERAAANKMIESVKIEHQYVEKELGQTKEKLRHVSFRLLLAEEKERKRIAQEIHDGIGQHWAIIKFRLENILQQLDEQLATPLKDIIPIIQVGMEETRRIQMNLRPPLLDDLGILATIIWVCREFQKAHPDIHLETKISVEEHEVPSDVKTVVYRLTQEALNNIAKHSKADLVILSLGKKQGKIEFTIQDNGQGFDLSEVLYQKSYEMGIGLAGMEERAQFSGGNLSIESGKGAGTTIQAIWPITT